MQTVFPNIGIKIPEIYLPKQGVDLKKRAVVACDQYTSQPEYWKQVQDFVGQDPSTYNIIFPEVYLEEEGKHKRIENIQKNMNNYLQEGILENQGNCCILIERKTSHTASRKGLVIALDLEKYDYSVGSQTLIRATEGTILDRLPPRIEIRNDAPLESPHIMVLIDDPEKTVIETLYTKIEKYTKLYDTDLMMNGGHITGYKIADEESIQSIIKNIEKLANKETFLQKYKVEENKGVLLFAMGDGNHSLATAKAIWEEKKQTLNETEKQEHPARFALVELVNIHDNGLVFEPIHRVVFNIQAESLQEDMITYFAKLGSEVELKSYTSLEEMKKHLQASDTNHHNFCMIYTGRYIIVSIKNPKFNLEVGNVQAFLDDYLNKHTQAKIDYIHGENVTEQLAIKEGNIGFILPIMDKKEFFPTVIIDGALPRKTFSMGESEEKRYYLECRKIK
ncbi:MAG TPA: DUF1015 domain-containing protein [Candidatus Absconditabacterales bacterium]|nr:DUF1015 domain-containing protein [Candidatus Absconditabacterales bacterium]